MKTAIPAWQMTTYREPPVMSTLRPLRLYGILQLFRVYNLSQIAADPD